MAMASRLSNARLGRGGPATPVMALSATPVMAASGDAGDGAIPVAGYDRWQSPPMTTAVGAERIDLSAAGRDCCGMPILTGHARLAGIIGWPVTHSRSPRLHGFWLERHAVDGAYVPLAVRPREFATAVRGLAAAGFAGANVTQPHKRAAFALCDAVESSAQHAGAVNTMVFRGGRITGSNTDGWGFLANLRAHGVEPTTGPVLLLGAGGAARAIAAALLETGVPVTIANRTPEHAEALAADLRGLRVLPWEQRNEALSDQALLVNATSLGMQGQPPLAVNLDYGAPGLAVADIVYVPLETALLASAAARGLRAVEGLGMLLFQAIPGFRAWFGVEPQVDADLRRFVAADLLPVSPRPGALPAGASLPGSPPSR